MAKSFQVDANELCWWYVKELVDKCGVYNSFFRIYYLLPRECLDVGLRKLYDDNEVKGMGEIAFKHRCVELFVQHGVDAPLMAI